MHSTIGIPYRLASCQYAATTLRIYAHVIPGAQRQAADAMEAVLAV